MPAPGPNCSGMGKRLGVVVLLVLVAMPAAVRADVPDDAPDVYAHRGGAGIAPEDTLGAFRQAHKLFGERGLWIELDTQLTADGVLVVLHDDSLDRTTTCTGDVIAKTAAELAPCDASKAFPGWPTFEPVPLLRDVLTEGMAAGWRLSIEIKNIPGEANFDPPGTLVADALVQLIDETGFPKERLVIQSFWPLSLDRVEQTDAGLHTALLTTSSLGFNLTENAAFATARGYEIASPDHASVDMAAETVQLAQSLGRDVVVWTVNEAADIRRAAGWGVDGIISDDPGSVYETLAG